MATDTKRTTTTGSSDREKPMSPAEALGEIQRQARGAPKRDRFPVQQIALLNHAITKGWSGQGTRQILDCKDAQLFIDLDRRIFEVIPERGEPFEGPLSTVRQWKR